MSQSSRDPFARSRPLYASCDTGLETVLADELNALGAERVKVGHRGVSFFGDRVLLWRANLESRVANRILLPIAEFPCRDRDQLYEGARRIQWPSWFGPDETIAVDASSHKSEMEHTGFMGQVIKDAICDSIRQVEGRRPSVERRNPDIAINAHLDRDHCTISLDSSGARLHRRGYRGETGEAPIKETIAAGMIALSGWKPGQVLFDPMCGSGTIVVEAALMASGVAPGLLRIKRAGFAFQRWRNHRTGPFGELVSELRARIQAPTPGLIYGADADPLALEATLYNAQRAGVFEALSLDPSPVEELKRPAVDGPIWVVSNPPYGKRLGSVEALRTLYGELGKALKNQFTGGHAALIFGESAPFKSIGLRPSQRYDLRNGPIPCKLLCYDLYAGTRRTD